MPRFRYKAIGVDGRPFSGELEGADAADVTTQLEAKGAQVESVLPIGERNPETGARSVQRLRVGDFQRLSSQLGDLTEAGLPLVSGLSALAEELPRSRFRRGLISIVRQLQAGGELAEVLKVHGAPADLQALIAAGAKTGHLGELLGRYAAERRRTSDMQRRTGLALAYPLVVLGLMAALLLFVLLWMAPQFKEIFEDFSTELPWATRMVVLASDLVVNYGVWLLAGTSMCLVIVAAVYLLVFDRLKRRRWACRIPIFGRLLRFSALARFSHLLAILAENGVPLPESLVLAGDGSGDAEIQAAGWLMAADVDAGESLDRAAYNAATMSSTLVAALAWHQQTDIFADVLRRLSEMYEARAHAQSGLVASFWMPIILVLSGLIVGVPMVALYWPLFDWLFNWWFWF